MTRLLLFFFAVSSLVLVKAQDYEIIDSLDGEPISTYENQTFVAHTFTDPTDPRIRYKKEDETAIVFKITPAKVAQVSKTLTKDDVFDGSYSSGIITISDPVIEIKNITPEVIKKNVFSNEYPVIAFKIIQEDRWKKIHLDSFINDKYVFQFDSIVRHAKLERKYVKSCPLQLDSNEYFIPMGVHSDIREFRMPYSCGIVTYVLKMEQALIKLGYPMTEDNVLTDEDKLIMIEFQKKNNLPVGRMNVETMQALGIEGY